MDARKQSSSPSAPPKTHRLPRPAWLDHPRLRQGYYYALPGRLLEEVLPQLGQAKLDADLVDLDRKIAATVDRAPQLVGFRRGEAVHHELVRYRPPSPLLATDASEVRQLAQWAGRTEAQVELALDQAAPALGEAQTARRAYCGWLMTNPTFVRAHDALWRRWGDRLQGSVPVMGPGAVRPEALAEVSLAQGEQRQFLRALEKFLRQWDLAQLAGPRLPVPPPQQFPVLTPPPGHLAGEAVASFHAARVLPLPAGERLRQTADAAVARGGAGRHLRDWVAIVGASNAAKHSIPRYGRVFELQHFWRVLHDRYGPACERRRNRLVPAFARYLGVAEATVRADCN